MGWTVIRIDAKTAFLRTGKATRKVYVIPLNESKLRETNLWLLLTAAYGLVNQNSKWQVKSYEDMYSIGLIQCQQVPQLLYMHNQGKLILEAAKIVDDIKIAGTQYHTSRFISLFNVQFELWTVVEGPGVMRFFGINVEQYEDYTVHTDAEDKLNALTEYYISRFRRKQFS